MRNSSHLFGLISSTGIKWNYYIDSLAYVREIRLKCRAKQFFSPQSDLKLSIVPTLSIAATLKQMFLFYN